MAASVPKGVAGVQPAVPLVIAPAKLGTTVGLIPDADVAADPLEMLMLWLG